jgi:hypothetical protein
LHSGIPFLSRRRQALLALHDLLGAELRDAGDQLHRDRLGEREADRALATDLVRREFILERGDEGMGILIVELTS